jgi:hypothetical protein
LADLGIAYQGVGRRNDLINLSVDPVSTGISPDASSMLAMNA